MKAHRLLLQKVFLAAFLSMATLLSFDCIAQVKIGTNPTTIGSNSNLEVEGSTSGRKVTIDKTTGQVTIADGTQGDGKVLKSDAYGNASWQTLEKLKVPENVWIGEQSGTYSASPLTGYGQLKERIPLVARPESGVGYDPETKLYTIQQAGYYRVSAGARISGSTYNAGAASPAFVRVVISEFGVFSEFTPMGDGQVPTLTTFWEGYMAAGTSFGLEVHNYPNQQAPSNINVTKGFLSVTKLF